MKKGIKIVVVAIVLTSILWSALMVKAASIVDELLNTALTNKTFYSYNMAYAEIIKIKDINLRNTYLLKLSKIEGEVLTPTVNNFTKKLEELFKTSSGRLYDQIVTDVSNSALDEMDKGYLLGELTGWGKKLVYTPEYTASIDKLVIAWNCIKSDESVYNKAILEAEKSIGNVKNNYSKEYLLEQVQQIKGKRIDSTEEPSTSNKKGYVNNSYLNIRSVPSVQDNEPIGKLYYYTKINIVDTVGEWYKIDYKNSFGYVSKAYIQLYSAPPTNVMDISANITKKFELGNSKPIAGNFDGAGLSLGYLQWCIGPGTLQPLLERMDNEYNDVMTKVFSKENYDSIHAMLQDPLDKQLLWAKGINNEQNKIKEPWYTELLNLYETPEFKKIQNDAEVLIVNRAMKICDKYKLKTVRGFALAFDIATQNGSITSSASAIIDEAMKENPNISEKELLKVIANAVADCSAMKEEDVRLRKMAIVNGMGNVHGAMYYLDRDYNLSDNTWR